VQCVGNTTKLNHWYLQQQVRTHELFPLFIAQLNPQYDMKESHQVDAVQEFIKEQTEKCYLLLVSVWCRL